MWGQGKETPAISMRVRVGGFWFGNAGGILAAGLHNAPRQLKKTIAATKHTDVANRHAVAAPPQL